MIYLSGENAVSMPADDRALGFMEFCGQEGLHCLDPGKEIDARLYASLDYHAYIEKILTEFPEIDGIFASSDVIAAQVIQICSKRGIKIPEQIRLVGFDDSSIASLTTPGITTIRQPVREMAEMAVRMLIRAERKEIVPNRTTLPVTLIRRETT